ncbi:GGDEF domain-containing protein [Tardiphaga sp.]|uniref:GGDEF domain-containing protein n=1 Tax=Tardiphaga sp. TaxID=1926292 RepID=UPI0019B1BBA7|nr:GGDEF domain-containing protein [Tardiphaga sp.]MBC7577741.1 GGDEF domain-containing protein [Tardiphaga sp.]
MTFENSEAIDPIAEAAMASMGTYAISPTPDNFAIWYEYHSGKNPNLQRTIDIVISNRRGFDGAALKELHNSFFSTTEEQQVLRQTSLQVMEAAQEVLDLLDVASAEDNLRIPLVDEIARTEKTSFSNLTRMLEHLINETSEMAKRSDHLGIRMRRSAEKIEALERTLDDARREATIDALTGISNRRSFDANLNELAGEAMNTGEDLCLMILDVDHFKHVNDTYGHPVGDQVLQFVATTIQQHVRGQDRAARYGGEEFAIILPRTPIEGAAKVGEYIRIAFEKHKALCGTSQQPIPGVTVSIGISCYDPGEKLLEWSARADTALYQAKREGRNCVRLGMLPD